MNESQDIFITEEAFRRRYEYGPDDILGEGGFAQVFKAFDKQFEEYVALKFYNKGEQGKYDVLHEMKDSRSYSHKNIIRVHDAFMVKFEHAGIHSYVQVGVLEFANGGNLRDFIDTKPSREVFMKVLVGILNALDYLHSEKNLIHRDLSPENILMYKIGEKWVPKIADFGISKKIEAEVPDIVQKKSTQLLGKTDYMAPEQFYPEKFGIKGKINTNVDLWSFGIILYELFLNRTPFAESDENPMRTIQSITNDPLPDLVEIPEPYKKIIKQCLCKDARKRIQSAREIIANLESHERPADTDYKKTTPIRELRLPRKNLKGLWISLIILATLIGGFFIIKVIVSNKSRSSEIIQEITGLMDNGNYKGALGLFNDLGNRSKRNPDISLLQNECVLWSFVLEDQIPQAIVYYQSLPHEVRLNPDILIPYRRAKISNTKDELSRLLSLKSYSKAKDLFSGLDSVIIVDSEIQQIKRELVNAITVDSLLEEGIYLYEKEELEKAKSKFSLVRSNYDPQNQLALEYIQEINDRLYKPPVIPSTPDCIKYYAGNNIKLDQRPDTKQIRLISICVNDTAMKITLELQPSSDDATVYPPGYRESFFIEYGHPKRALELRKLNGWERITSSVREQTSIELIFDPLPERVEKFDLKEGKESIRLENTRYWDFIGVELNP